MRPRKGLESGRNSNGARSALTEAMCRGGTSNMANQLLLNPFPLGVSESQYFQELNGSIQLAGSAVTTGEPINWSDLISGIGYNEVNYLGNGVNGNGAALVTALTASGSGSTAIITATSASNFSVGQQIRFKGCTSTLGLLLNGLSFTVTASTPGTSFVISSQLTGSGSGETGMAIVDKTVHPLLVGTTPTQTITVTAISPSGSVCTVTAANNLLPGAQVIFGTFTTGTLGPKLVLAGPMYVLASTSSAFTVQMPSALTGSTGACTATGINPPQPFSCLFWSSLGSGYEYTYSSATGVLYTQTTAGFTPAGTNAASTLSIGAGTPATYPVGTAANTGSTTLVATGAVTIPLAAQVFTGTAVAAAGLAALAAGAYPAGVLGDVIKWTAKFPKVAQF